MRGTSGPTRARGLLLGLIMAAVAVFVWAPAALGAPATQTWVGQASGPTPDLDVGGLQIFDPSGTPTPAGNSAGTINIALDGVTHTSFCIDIERSFNTATQTVDVTSAAPTTNDERAVIWVIVNRTPTGAETPASNTAGAVAQVAVWILRGEVSPTTPTSSPSINAAAIALVAEARAATATPATLALSASAPAAGATTSTVTVTGRPGATVALSVTSGAGTLGATSLVIGPGGTATTTLTASGPGAVAISASTAGDGTFVNVQPAITTRQAVAYAQPSTLSATTTATFTQTTPNVPNVPTTSVPTLVITKTGPKTARVLKNISYTITVRNTSTTAAKKVVLKDAIPKGMSFVRSSRTSTLKNGTLTFNLGTVAAGASRSVTVTLKADAGVTGRRTNVATVSAQQVRPLRAAAVTIFRPLARRVQPAVTG